MSQEYSKVGKLIHRSMLVIALIVCLGASVWKIYSHNPELEKVYGYVESHQIDLEAAYHRKALEAAADMPPANLKPGIYTREAEGSGIQVVGQWHFEKDGRYRYTLTVGDGITRKQYGVEGSWWVQGRVLYTKMMTGDPFLLLGESTTGSRLTRALIVSDANKLVIQSSNCQPIQLFPVQV